MLCRTALFLCLGLVLLQAAREVRAQESQPTEYQIKAAFLYNFAKFIEWPPEAFAQKESPFVIGILGDNPFGTDLEKAVHNKTVNDRPLEVKECRSVTEATNCHILFISSSEKKPSASEKKRLSEIFAGLRGNSVLTVGETDGFTENGGMINFVQESNKIRFRISDDAAKAARLKISSKLLSLAVRSPH